MALLKQHYTKAKLLCKSSPNALIISMFHIVSVVIMLTASQDIQCPRLGNQAFYLQKVIRNILVQEATPYHVNTIFTWLNATATITHVVKLDTATIQGWLLFKGSVYYTEASSVGLLFNYYNLIKLKRTREFHYVSALECCFNMHSYTRISCSHVSYMRQLHTSFVHALATHISCSLCSLNKYNLHSHGRHNVDMQLQL